jgi:glycosyltransferase involved in cell wall biosynthesis/SAM-dependent methyltransferase
MDSVPFTEEVVSRKGNLGGSESSCLGLAQALAAAGHAVSMFATKMEIEPGTYNGVQWLDAEESLPHALKHRRYDVFCSLRMPGVFLLPNQSRWKMLWAQDLMLDAKGQGLLHRLDEIAFVSQFHREQWCNLEPTWRPLAWVTGNGYDPRDLLAAGQLVSGDVVDVYALPKARRHHYIYVSRPERGIDGLIALWPKIRAAYPEATLAVCRYSSMYDAGGWGRVVASYDERLQALNERVGGITFLGELSKPSLYAAIGEAWAMLYPTSQDGFAETNCVAATEAQACGTPFIGSWRGALPETLHPEAAILIKGDWRSEDYQTAFLGAIARLQDNPSIYQAIREAGKANVVDRSFAAYAAQWVSHFDEVFERRAKARPTAVLRQLLHWDNHVAAKVFAEHVINPVRDFPLVDGSVAEWKDAITLCDDVIAQRAQTAEHYAKYAIQDAMEEAKYNQRLHRAADLIVEHLQERVVEGAAPPVVRILDMACGNGAMAMHLVSRLVSQFDVSVHGVDYSEGVLALANEARLTDGVIGPRCTFEHGGLHTLQGQYDIVFCGEFLEHAADPAAVLNTLEAHCAPNGLIVLTVPCGPFAELLDRHVPRQRGHLHSFMAEDLGMLLAPKVNPAFAFYEIGSTPHGTPVGYWIMSFRPGGQPAEPFRREWYLATALRERPYERITACLIVRDSPEHVRACLDTFYNQVDAIVIHDYSQNNPTSKADARGEYPSETAMEIARFVDMHGKVRLTHHDTWPNHFAEARNRTVAEAEALGTEWIFWIDIDERLMDGHALRPLATFPGVLNAYAVEQHHLCIDQPNFFDKPLRLFRANRGVKFYGAIHEQPEEGIDAPIVPALHQTQTKIAHFGYIDFGIRRHKMVRRNLPLLNKQMQSPERRRLDFVLYLRDAVHMVTMHSEGEQALTPQSKRYASKALQVWDAEFSSKPVDGYYDLAWPYYQQLLGLLPGTLESGWTFSAAQGTLKGTPRLEKFRARSVAEIKAITAAKVARYLDPLVPVPTSVDPVIEWAALEETVP